MMRTLTLCLLLATPVAAQDVTDAPGGILRWLDKVTGETADIELSRGQSAVSGHLTMQLDECRYPSDNPASNAFAHLTITDAKAEKPVFSGWMIAASPALSALDHARYDVWILRCMTPESAALPEVDPDADVDPDASPEPASDGG
ncbi:MAG: DUF2155 domain-containing protein [Paracoccaceae bacterium]